MITKINDGITYSLISKGNLNTISYSISDLVRISIHDYVFETVVKSVSNSVYTSVWNSANKNILPFFPTSDI